MNNRARKVLHIITRLEKGGSAKNTLYSLSVEGFENFLIYGPCAFSEKYQTEAAAFEAPHLTRDISLYKDILAFFEIYFLIKKIGPDIIHTHTSKAGALGRAAAFFYNLFSKKTIVVHTPHGHLFYGYYGPLRTWLFKLVEKALSLITDHYIALTEGEKLESLAQGLGKDNIWQVIPSGIDFPERLASRKECRKKLSLPDKAFIAIFAGRLEKVKGPDIFLEIASMLKDEKNSPSLYLIVGEGSMRKDIESLAFKKCPEGKVIFLGHREDIFDCFCASDILIQPSRNEAMGRSVIEAQYCGLPVVVSSVCGLPWVIKDGVTGFVFSKDNPYEGAEKVKRLSDPCLREKFSQAAREYSRTSNPYGEPVYSSSAMRRQLRDFYSSLFL